MQQRFFFSCDIEPDVRLRIGFLEGIRHRESLPSIIDDPYLPYSGLYSGAYSDLYVTCSLYADGKPLCLPVQTAYRPFYNEYRWDEWLKLPIKYKDLPLTSMVVLTVWDCYAPRRAMPIGGTSFPLFNKNRVLRKGRQRLLLWQNREGDGSPLTATPGKIREQSEDSDRLELLIRKYERGKMPKIEWLDRYSFMEIEKLRERTTSKRSGNLFLHIELPTFDYPVLFQEKREGGSTSQSRKTKDIVIVHDPEATRDKDNPNPMEMKQIKLSRAHQPDFFDKELIPNNRERAHIKTIERFPPTKHLSIEDKKILWKFRYYLRNNKKVLTKFLKCVDWNDQQEAKHAVELMHQWDPIDTEDALELLTSHFTNGAVREYAVSRLDKSNDEEIMSYLLQLVQALRYEKPGKKPSLTNFLICRAVNNPELANFFFWYLSVECESKDKALFEKKVHQLLIALLKTEEGHTIRDRVTIQKDVVRKTNTLITDVKALPYPRPRKIAAMKEMLMKAPYNEIWNTKDFWAPLNPTLKLTGILPEKCTMFKSALSPICLCFQTEQRAEYPVIFKMGDDLRQDQLVIQLITLMDKLLKKENLDLKLTPYRVLATSFSAGMLECVPRCISIASVLKRYDGDIKKYLRELNPDKEGEYGIKPQVLDTFVRSCAGYCVITYILGIGDRHLDNLLLTEEGNLLHIDFGFILGHDPKPFPPPMKLCKEMVEGMGGALSPFYTQFKQHCCEAYNILRKSANLILNLLSLMVDADIPHLSSEPEKSILKVQNNFCLDMSDTEASHNIQSLINESVSALFPQITETIHRWAQYWRS